MAFQVKTTAKAKRALDAILSRLLSQEAGETGLRWFKGWRETVVSLSHSPQRCSFAPENDVFPFEVSQLLYGRNPNVYRILFTIAGDTVSVLHICHGRRQPPARLPGP